MPLRDEYTASDSTPVVEESTDQVAASLYRHHLYSARHFSDLACELEHEQQPGAVADSEIVRKHRAYVMGAVLSAAAFLEASINELYLEVQDHLDGAGGGRRVLSVPAHFWSPVARPPVLHKYQLALVVADAEPFDEGRSPFREADGLIALRDALVHARPEWRDRHGRRQNLERRLRSKFKQNPLVTGSEPEFPDRLLGSGCAQWAVKVAERFSNEFCHRMAIPARGLGAGG